ncbi:TIM barrel protein [Spirillospora sp. CA-294931]|uniref:TIM barrel protein n=1 Tax=Spirillospora sp. CA-294931 TaxID=3240042 RepID=UPI003D8CEC20
MRRAGAAPISWGVCEVPGWGHQLPPARVLAEMRELGVTATEFGPDGFLPPEAPDRSALLASYGLEPIGGFVPVVLHDPGHDPLPVIDRALDAFGPGTVLVLAAVTGLDGYDERPDLDAKGRDALRANLAAAGERAAGRGNLAVLHPHVGTMVEREDEVAWVLEHTGVPLCLDTGHLLIGGTDPARLAREAPGRIAHVHLKDVDASLARRVRDGELAYTQAVRDGIYRPLGQGDIDLEGIVRALERAGYEGWYVLEQDTILEEGAAHTRPAEDVRASLAFLRDLTEEAR